MNNTNICWECKHSKLKLKILVPQNITIKEYINKTGNFQSDIVAISKEKRGQYNIWFRSEGNLRLLSFKMLHICKLKHGQEKTECVRVCESYDAKNDQTTISNIVYSKNVNFQSSEK
jgi:hypothetical protein